MYRRCFDFVLYFVDFKYHKCVFSCLKGAAEQARRCLLNVEYTSELQVLYVSTILLRVYETRLFQLVIDFQFGFSDSNFLLIVIKSISPLLSYIYLPYLTLQLVFITSFTHRLLLCDLHGCSISCCLQPYLLIT